MTSIIEKQCRSWGSTEKEIFEAIADKYGSDETHKRDLAQLLGSGRFLFASPVMKKAKRPISCFVNEVEDTMSSIRDIWDENTTLGGGGGGIGTYWGNVRSSDSGISGRGNSSGIIPFIKVQDVLTSAVSQGANRRGASVATVPVWHPEIIEFINTRLKTGSSADPNRRYETVYIAVAMDRDFLERAAAGFKQPLICPQTGRVVREEDAREILLSILRARRLDGVPYITFVDNMKAQVPAIYKHHGLYPKHSNLCQEIMLHTGKDHLNKTRTGVCCLGSINLVKFAPWNSEARDNLRKVVRVALEALDNVLTDYVNVATEAKDRGLTNSVYSALRERSVGLGVMGLHSFYIANGLPWSEARDLNKDVFKTIREAADEISYDLAKTRGPALDFLGVPENEVKHERFTHKLAIAPTVTISELAGGVSQGIDPRYGMVFASKSMDGESMVVTAEVKALLKKKNILNDDIVRLILRDNGSLDKVPLINEREREIYKTAYEINQDDILIQAADRQIYICQGQSVNLFYDEGRAKEEELRHVFLAHFLGVKSLYYRHGRADSLSKVLKDASTCEACQ